ncbi:MAG TPA: hypothetical protein VG125_15345 [Pirellulales bacterium]|nr:hypothetical protein [Pirellulales bacterium]
MATEAAPLPAERRRIGPGTILLIAVAVLAVPFTLTFFLGLFLSAQRVKAELARIRDAGEPVTPADLEAFYQLPPDTPDVTPLWVAATEAVRQSEYTADAAGLPLVGGSADDLPDPGEPWPQQYRSEKFLFKYTDLLDGLHEAADRGGAARYPTRFSDGIGMPTMQHQLRFVTLLLALESEVYAHSGNAQAAAASVHAMFALARSLQNEPVVASQLMRMAADHTAVDYLERASASVTLPDDDLALIDEDLASIDYYSAFHRSMLGDRVIGIRIFEHPDTLGDEAPAWNIFRQADFAFYLQLMDEFIRASRLKNHTALRAAIERVNQQAAQVTGSATARWRYPMTRLVVPSFLPVVDAFGRVTARRDVARMAIAAERFRRSKGHWPATLDDLVPDFAERLPADPFSGGPLKFQLASDGCRVYSVGPDGIDQGGSGLESQADDIAFRLPNHHSTGRSGAD